MNHKSQCLSGIYKLFSEQHALSLDPQFQWGKKMYIIETHWQKTNPFNREKIKMGEKKKEKKQQLRNSHTGGIPLSGGRLCVWIQEPHWATCPLSEPHNLLFTMVTWKLSIKRKYQREEPLHFTEIQIQKEIVKQRRTIIPQGPR